MPKYIYVFSNTDKLIEITQALYSAITFVGIDFQLLLLWLMKDQVNELIQTLEKYVNESKYYFNWITLKNT